MLRITFISPKFKKKNIWAPLDFPDDCKFVSSPHYWFFFIITIFWHYCKKFKISSILGTSSSICSMNNGPSEICLLLLLLLFCVLQEIKYFWGSAKADAGRGDEMDRLNTSLIVTADFQNHCICLNAASYQSRNSCMYSCSPSQAIGPYCPFKTSWICGLFVCLFY